MKKKILIVDDCCQNRKKMRNCFPASNCIIEEVSDGEKAFNYCMNKSPDIILLSHDVPNLCGLGFLRLYKDTLSFQKKLPPVIFLTSDNSDKNIHEEALNLGALACIQHCEKVETHVMQNLKKLGLHEMM